MDEPLSNLDAKLRVSTRTQIAALQRRLGTTTVYVTHDQVEAMTMGDRVALLHEGIVQQCGTPRELYERPANVFVAGFIGSPAMNLRQGRLTEQGADIGGMTVPVSRQARAAAASDGDGTVTVGIRPKARRSISACAPTSRTSSPQPPAAGFPVDRRSGARATQRDIGRPDTTPPGATLAV
ncbi:hypothetical protein SAMN06265360_10676 [Haloechinothrix alba]|uniref:MalK-like OB fold domain-containing protein n=1 Tax=Haloechinothrix alba TaxID=664784 RepID=A0A238WEP7_9PSEU|nr:hypothetical protein SAMN06265360_10676 [Haloechinothrix alba]